MLVRFDYRDPWPISSLRGTTDFQRPSLSGTSTNVSVDAEMMCRMVDRFRGDGTFGPVLSPYRFRVLVPLLASVIPLPALSAINVVNFAAFCMSVVVLLRILLRLRVDVRTQALCMGLYTVSFPVLYYSTVGLTEPVVLLLSLTMILSALRNAQVSVLILSLLAAATKETAVLAVLVITVTLISCATRSQGRKLQSLSPLAFFVLATILIRSFPMVDDATPARHLLTTVHVLNPRVYLVAFLSVSPLVWVLIWHCRWRHARTLVSDSICLGMAIGLLGSWLIWATALFVAHPDGRPLWLGHPFAVILIARLRSNLH